MCEDARYDLLCRLQESWDGSPLSPVDWQSITLGTVRLPSLRTAVSCTATTRAGRRLHVGVAQPLFLDADYFAYGAADPLVECWWALFALGAARAEEVGRKS